MCCLISLSVLPTTPSMPLGSELRTVDSFLIRWLRDLPGHPLLSLACTTCITEGLSGVSQSPLLLALTSSSGSDSQVPGDVRLISLARHPDPGSAETHLTLPAGNWL
uniref:Uncharacterized protein n=1 Tax=Ananas comosus var. bracteatus TaxID=296719 RepID=A0A6V7NYT1_ANACO|nr:unnamed protein product [Ananas comosus var. bracteatus]